MDLELTGRVALVVGGRGYIGSVVAETLRREGARVVVASRNADGDDAVAMDTASQESVDAGVARVLDQHGRIDVLVVTAAPAAGTLDRSVRRTPSRSPRRSTARHWASSGSRTPCCPCSARRASAASWW